MRALFIRSSDMKKRKPHTWGSIYLNAIARGYDNGYAAWLAYNWERRQLKKQKKEAVAEGLGHSLSRIDECYNPSHRETGVKK